MKNLLVVSLLIVGGISQAAQYESFANCNAHIQSRGPIKGYTIALQQEVNGDSYQAVMAPICLACMIKPTVIPVKLNYSGMNLGVVGEGLNLNIALESFIPTKTHPATAQVKSFAKGRKLSYVCEFAN